MQHPFFYYEKLLVIHPAGWETARGGGMTSCNYLWTDLSTLTALYACWGGHPAPKSCYLQWVEFLGYFFNGKRNASLSQHIAGGLENWVFFSWFLFKTCVSEHFVVPFCLPTSLRCLYCAGMPLPFFCKGLAQLSFPIAIAGSNIRVKFAVEKNMCASKLKER